MANLQDLSTGNGAGAKTGNGTANTAARSKRAQASNAPASTLSAADTLCLLQEDLHLFSKTGKVRISQRDGILAIILFPASGDMLGYDATTGNLTINGEIVSHA